MVPEVSLTPLVDTCLTLLLIFLMASPVVTHGIKVNLPKASSAQMAIPAQLVVSMNPEGQIYLNSSEVTRSEMVETIKRFLVEDDQKPVIVKADESIAYGQVVAVIDDLKRAGVRLVAMAAQATVTNTP